MARGLLPCSPPIPSPLALAARPARRWLDLPGSATFDIVLLHYGSADPAPACAACAAVLHMAGPKWHLLWQATRLPVWRSLVAGKRAVMVADDDLVLDTCSINRRGGGVEQGGMA